MITAASVVENGQRHWGRFLRTPNCANPTQAFSGAKGAFESFRTKEWAGFTITHREFFSSMIIQDAKYLLSSEWYLYDIEHKTLAQHAANRPPGAVKLPSDLLHSRVDFAAKGYRIGYELDDRQIALSLDLADTTTGPRVSGEILLDVAGAGPPLVVSTRLPKGSMYTNKIIFPASGAVRVGDREYTLDPAVDFAILDEHKSHLPYRTTWTWGTFALPVNGGYAGANFAIRPSLPGQEEESCIWTPDAAEPLANVEFVEVHDNSPLRWEVRSADRRLDLAFSPIGHKRVDQQLVFAAIHYSQMYGTYSGTLRGANAIWELEGVHGVLEDMAMRA
ncbi:MAG: DUF2804 domain-containing protein [Bifidobacteriaceae bacterium]|jgi:hypothetical protein|nr:DUF2804 domain-containing protein [Bifidobacteriaceae bacterium]